MVTRKRYHLSLLFATSLLFYTGIAARVHNHERAMKVGKTGEITFDKETKVGDMTLKPGRYRFQHRVEGADHFIHFTDWTTPGPFDHSSGAPKAHPGEVNCRLEMLNKRVVSTTVFLTSEGDGVRVTKIEVAGENFAHLF